MAINKVVSSFDEAVADVFDGATILCGGFLTIGGVPSYLYRALAKRPVKNLTIVGNAMVSGREVQEVAARTMKVPDDWDDASVLFNNGQVSKIIISAAVLPIMGMSTSFPVVKALRAGQNIEFEMIAQGTLAERIRAAKAGIPAFYTATGVGTEIQKGKETKFFDGKEYVLERAIKADFAFIRGYKADRYGNVVYKGTSRTFNPTMAGAAKVTIVEVDEVVELGELDPEAVVTPAIYVDRVVKR